MTQRLPVQGSDNGVWGTILNGYLLTSHNSDGTLLKSSLATAGAVTSVNGKAPISGAVTLVPSDIGAPTTLAALTDVSNAKAATTGQVLTYINSKWTPSTITPDATTTSKGVIQLAGDLAGTAAAPTVPGLATKITKTGDTMTGTLVVPSLKLTGGSLVSGNVLISDASGNASWAAPSAAQLSTPPVIALGSVSGTVTVDLELLNGAGNGFFTLTQTGNITLSFTNVPSTPISFEIWATQGGSGGYSITSTITWLGGSFTPATAYGDLNVIPVESLTGAKLYAYAS